MSVVEANKKSRQASLFTAHGEARGQVALPSVFEQEPNLAVMHQAHLRQLANARQGTASTKTRGEVSGGGAKPYRQKGTGRARHGSEREPQMSGGGTVFGPHPRSYRQEMPRKMRRLALRSALSVKADEGKVQVVEAFEFETPKTSQMVELLRALGVEDTALVVVASSNLNVARSVANLPWAKAILVNNLNIHDLFTYDQVVIQREALELIDETFGNGKAPEDLPEGGAAAGDSANAVAQRARRVASKRSTSSGAASESKPKSPSSSTTSRSRRSSAAKADKEGAK